MTQNLYLTHLELLQQKLFHKTPQELYEKLIELGKKASSLSEEDKTPENKVIGCQSLMYLKCELDSQGCLNVTFSSDALISAGLAAACCFLMNGLTPEEVLKADLAPLESLGIGQALTPGRANGLGSILHKIKRDALMLLMKK